MWYTGTLEEMQTVEGVICVNAGIPNDKGTTKWSTPKETINLGVYAIPVPVDGWNGFTYEDMTVGVTSIEHDDVEFPVEGEI